MKTILMVIMGLILPYMIFANEKLEYLTVPPDKILSIEIVAEMPSCTILQIETTDGQVLWNVVAAIATHFLPEAVQAICTRAGGNPDHCEVVYDVSSALVSLGGKGIYKGMTRGFRWIAKRMGYTQKSKAIIEAKTYERAGVFKDIFDAYRNAGCMKWENAGMSDDYISFEGSFRSTNNNNRADIYLVVWTAYYIKYTGLLKAYPDGSGRFRVFYKDPSCNCNKFVEQQMSFGFVSQGISILGRNPVDISSGTQAYDYAPDNFYIYMDYFGNISVTIIDQAYSAANASMKWISNYSEKRKWLEAFGMN